MNSTDKTIVQAAGTLENKCMRAPRQSSPERGAGQAGASPTTSSAHLRTQREGDYVSPRRGRMMPCGASSRYLTLLSHEHNRDNSPVLG